MAKFKVFKTGEDCTVCKDSFFENSCFTIVSKNCLNFCVEINVLHTLGDDFSCALVSLQLTVTRLDYSHETESH